MIGAIKSAVEGIAKPITDIINKKVSDRDLRNELIADLTGQEMKQAFQLTAKRIDLAIKQAESKSLFVSGARPGFQWTCNLGVAYAFLLQPILTPVSMHWLGQPMPPIPIEALMAACGSALGFGALRSREKRLGVARDGGYAMHAAAEMSGGPNDK